MGAAACVLGIPFPTGFGEVNSTLLVHRQVKNAERTKNSNQIKSNN
jgi:hypothetical protein